MYVRYQKRKCGVKGCKHIGCYHITVSRSPGNSVNVCRDCLAAALNAIDALPAGAKSNVEPIIAVADGMPMVVPNIAAEAVETTEESVEESAESESTEIDDIVEDILETVEKAEEEEAKSAVESNRIDKNDWEYRRKKQNRFVCPKCGRAVNNEYNLNKHMIKCEGIVKE